MTSRPIQPDPSTDDEFALANQLLVELHGGWLTTCAISQELQLGFAGAIGDVVVECTRLSVDGPHGVFEVDCQRDPSTAAVLLSMIRKARVRTAIVCEPADLQITFETGHSWHLSSTEDRWDVQGAEVVIESVPGEGLLVLTGDVLGNE